MPRLFVAARPPVAVRAALSALMDGVPGARWQDDDQLHLTLRFIGDIDARTADDAAAALASIHAGPIDAAIDGVGAFDRRGVIDTLWAGVSPAAPLAALHKKIDQALVRAGLEPERRAYRPHITLARFSRGGGSVENFRVRHAGLAGPAFTIDSFALYESHLGGDGARYLMVERYGLA